MVAVNKSLHVGTKSQSAAQGLFAKSPNAGQSSLVQTRRSDLT